MHSITQRQSHSRDGAGERRYVGALFLYLHGQSLDRLAIPVLLYNVCVLDRCHDVLLELRSWHVQRNFDVSTMLMFDTWVVEARGLKHDLCCVHASSMSTFDDCSHGSWKASQHVALHLAGYGLLEMVGIPVYEGSYALTVFGSEVLIAFGQPFSNLGTGFSF